MVAPSEHWSEVTTDAFVAEIADIGCAAVAGDHVYWVCIHDLAATAEGGSNNSMQDTGAAYRAKRKVWLVASLIEWRVSRGVSPVARAAVVHTERVVVGACPSCLEHPTYPSREEGTRPVWQPMRRALCTTDLRTRVCLALAGEHAHKCVRGRCSI